MRSVVSRLDAVLIQAVIAGALSFAHLHEIAEAAGQSGWKAWAYPISVDLLLVAAWHRIRSNGGLMPWLWFLVALAASLGANVATAGVIDLEDVPRWLSILVAGWPALAFFGGTLLAHDRPAPAPAAVPVDPPAPAVTVERAAEPALPAELPAPADPVPPADSDPAPVPAAAPVVPPALVEHARKLADTHRARTGAAMDAETLRARLNVPPAMATAIADHLTQKEN